jgi:hypothetical protein
MLCVRTLVNLLGGLAIAAAMLAATTMWHLLNDPVSLATTRLGSLLLPVAHAIGHAIGVIAHRL